MIIRVAVVLPLGTYIKLVTISIDAFKSHNMYRQNRIVTKSIQANQNTTRGFHV